ncbi:hypothetical protein N0V83_001741 [Neocucurbitaria cava]|uniref:Metallo-beta-lactamase domain-containing protein n=1 Tax=Neocucurbitaria cava TaxID=798079 RepID=A0A9W8YG63_9PLEO|nr:hypothetical protein N0V83_001741 [Neocucurbitaria cava]
MPWRKITGQTNQPDTTPPTVTVQKPTFLPTRSTPKLRSTWLGHACYYIEYPSGLRVLFDPVFEDCCAPIQLKGLKRYTPPPCEIEDLPFVDVVVISHNHYDHLSYPTTQRIQKKFPEAHFFAPLGNKKWFESSGVPSDKCTELDWWESRDITLSVIKEAEKEGRVASMSVSSSFAEEEGGEKNSRSNITATITALPAQHLSARGPFDKCKTLWASWAVRSTPSSTTSPAPPAAASNVYFAGDTGYRSVPASIATAPDVDDYAPEHLHLPVCPAFSQIGTHHGPFDLGLIPIGAYAPREFFSNVHASPKDAVNILVDTKCRRALGMHWGTWVLTEEEVMEPPVKLREALRWKGVEEVGVFDVCDIGESREFDSGGIEEEGGGGLEVDE